MFYILLSGHGVYFDCQGKGVCYGCRRRGVTVVESHTAHHCPSVPSHWRSPRPSLVRGIGRGCRGLGSGSFWRYASLELRHVLSDLGVVYSGGVRGWCTVEGGVQWKG